ncbi:MAG: hypothetical protein LBH18_00980 [Spirochaetaceae bacterium]|nr:hypothetical protein [Spirochaetaceae bacterium]
MLTKLKMPFLAGLILLCSTSLFADEQITGRLIKASLSGVDTTKLYEPLVNITQSSVLGVRSFTLKLSGVNPRNSKQYEFYNDSNSGDSSVWKRRMRGVTVRPVDAYITVSDGPNNTNTIVINYEYRGRKGFGNVVYVVTVEK